MFNTFKEANKGVPVELVKERLKDKKYTRYSKPYKTLYYAGEVVTSKATS